MTAPRCALSRTLALASYLVIAAVTGAGGALAAEDAPAVPALPRYLKDVDLNQPAQAAFAGWPPDSMLTRPYWLPWSNFALQRAVVLNQPVFLLVTVPWSRAAQRMAEEALADPLVLRNLNHDYISILVSADRRPDLYARYGTGNWPAISLLLPDGSPMLSQVNPKNVALPITLGSADQKTVLFNLGEGRKYFDRRQAVLQGISQVYEKRVDLEEATSGSVDAKAIDGVVRWLLGNVDAKNGGFGAAPKYVLPGLMEWALLRSDHGHPAALKPARVTLEKMAASPLFDARDGGFHRMAAAPEWGSIQYEKMLASNVEMIRELVFALRSADDPVLRKTLAATAGFVTAALARPSGGFYLAQVADPKSPDGGGYWTAAEHDPAKAPPIDKLVLAGPNALAGAALLRAGALLQDTALDTAGRAALDVVLQNSFVAGRGAGHVIESEPDRGRYLVTQTEVALGLLDGYEATGDARYLAAARDLAEFVRNNLRVGKETAYRDHLAIGSEFGLLDMPLRPMTDNARFARVLLRLAIHGVMPEGKAAAKEILGTYAGGLVLHGVRAIGPALAIDEIVSEPFVVTIEGPEGDDRTNALRRAALNLPRGWVVITTARGASPAATLTWRGGTRRVTNPAGLSAGLQQLVSAGIGKP